MADSQTIPVRRAFNTLVAVGVTIGIVMLVRWCLREVILDRPMGRYDGAVADPTVACATKVYDLGELIPPSLAVTVMGIETTSVEKRMGMPYDVAEAAAAADAESRGWELQEDSSLNARLAHMAGQNVYKTPEGAWVCRRLIPLKGDDTLLKDFMLPVGGLTQSDAQTPSIGELETVRGARVLGRIPSPLRETILGLPALTQLMPRNGGHAFIVRAVSSKPVAEMRRDFTARMRTLAGWRAQEGFSGAWSFANISLVADVRPR